MLVTVAICTWNRADMLNQTLSEMHKLRIPDNVEWELLIVNNNCTDHTDTVISRHVNELPILRLFEQRQGQCHSRNCAMDAASGDVILFTDDDVLVDPDWLVHYCDAFQRFPGASYFGGTVDPLFEITPPGWIAKNIDWLGGCFALRQFGSHVSWISEEEPFGANMGFRTRFIAQARFNTGIGLCGGNEVRGDETEFIRRLKDKGAKGVWVGTARVRHYIPSCRLTRKYLWNYHRGQGVLMARTSTNVPVPRLFGRPRWLIRRYVQTILGVIAYYSFDSRRWLESYVAAAIASGALQEFRTLQARCSDKK